MPYRDDDGARDALAQARERRRNLPLFDRLEIASPCNRNWDDMMRTADDRVRACGACDKHVYNVSGMTVDEVDRLILATDGNACVRYYKRADGCILTADCVLGARRRARTRYAAAGVVVAMAAGYAVSQWPESPGYEMVADDDPGWTISEEWGDPLVDDGLRADADYQGGETMGSLSPFMARMYAARDGESAPEPPIFQPDLHVDLGFPHEAPRPAAQAASMPRRK
jgi:hypothetical protein